MDSHTDTELVQMTLNGESDAFGKLIQRHQSAVYATALHRIRSFADAQDVAQEAFIEAYKNLYRLREPAKFPGWLCTITRRQCNRWMRSQRENINIEGLNATQIAQISKNGMLLPDETSESRELQQKVLDAIASLPEKISEAVTMYYIDGLSYSEVASFLSIPKTTVKGRLRTGRQRLKERLAMVEETLKENRPDRGFSEAVQKLIVALKEEDWMAWHGALISGRVRDAKVIQAVVLTLKKDEDPDVRERATRILPATMDSKVTKPLIMALKDESPHVRATAARALSNMHHMILNEQKNLPNDAIKTISEVVVSLIAVLDDEDRDVRRAAAASLGKIRDERAVKSLRAISEDADKVVQLSVKIALAKMGEPGAMELVVEMLNDRNDDVIRGARFTADWMDELSDIRVIEPLLTIWEGADSYAHGRWIRLAVIIALIRIKDERAIELLVSALEDEYSQVRWWAACALERIGDERAIDSLASALKDEDPRVREMASRALASIRKSDSVT